MPANLSLGFKKHNNNFNSSRHTYSCASIKQIFHTERFFKSYRTLIQPISAEFERNVKYVTTYI